MARRGGPSGPPWADLKVGSYILMLVPSLALASPSGEVHGYLKDLAAASRSASTDVRWFANTSRLRLDAQGRWAWLSARVMYDHEATAGSVLDAPEFSLAKTSRDGTQFPWTSTVTDTPVWWRHKIYRAAVTARLAGAQAVLGRQRVVWGSGKFWNPTDLLHPYNPFAFERDERPAFDGTLLEWGPVAAAAALEDDEFGKRWLARGMIPAGAGDLALLAGRAGGMELLGLDAAVNVARGVLRAEAGAGTRASGRAQAVVGYDRTWPGVSLSVEAFYNGYGAASRNEYGTVGNAPAGTRNLGRWYAGALLGWEATPLLRADLASILNLTDGSVFLMPQARYSLMENLEVSTGYLAFAGETADELGRPPNSLIAQIQKFF